MSLQRERPLILALLLILTAASWALLIWQSTTAEMMDMSLTMDMEAGLFLGLWTVMMVAMMFPATTPINLAFVQAQYERSNRKHAFVPILIFVGAYLLIWTLFGGLAYLGANAASELARSVPWLMLNASRIGGGVLILAGLYQFTPFKRACLTTCCKPQQFMFERWRDGRIGALHMGLSHGFACLGANWLLCILLFPLGIMNWAAMLVLTVVIFAERVFPQAVRIAQVVGLALILYGIFMIVMPAAHSM
ncbi:DUF2182 domain-containing protein [Ktedonosporobacter rubrisoli]|uniref:DUF2182 domain-containing protein n=1 Tax=Ktedonosporobacter rubrisoli TaxID=2509675 RepID=A0A4V0YY64_KTERU|nr:DUF2182 domain-containing protein [Ktedonosporobacter rubrisoli]QBD75131.1 DUF2182 domain-containing protein [Ktedonosporobacter rubrisoli]